MRWRTGAGLAFAASALSAAAAWGQASTEVGADKLPPATSADVGRAEGALDSLLVAAKEEERTVGPVARAELSSLKLPATDQVSALRYCAFRIRFLNAADQSLGETARSKAGFIDAEKPFDSGTLIPYGTLFPTLDSSPLFNRRAGLSEKGTIYIGSTRAGCAVLTTGNPEAERAVGGWLSDQSTGWTPAGTNTNWRIYRIRHPNIWQRDIRLIRANLSPEARKAGIDAVDMVVMTGLP